MQVAPEIKFHDVDRSEWVETYIRGRLDHLDKVGSGITSAHVILSQAQASSQKGNLYSLMVEVRMPPHKDLAAKKQKVIRKMDTQLPALINQAFSAIERQVKKNRGKDRQGE